MIYNRGQPADLDNWAQRGNRGWGYADVLPYYRRSERRIGYGDDAKRGREGGIPVTDMDWIHPVSEAFIAGAVGERHPAQPRLQQRRPGRRRLLPAHDPPRPPGQRGARLPAPGDGAAAGIEVRTNARASGHPVRGQARDRRPLPARARRPARARCTPGAR